MYNRQEAHLLSRTRHHAHSTPVCHPLHKLLVLVWVQCKLLVRITKAVSGLGSSTIETVSPSMTQQHSCGHGEHGTLSVKQEMEGVGEPE